MLGIGSLPHQASHTFEGISTSVFDGALALVIPSRILESV
jgi:hypothetical protein